MWVEIAREGKAIQRLRVKRRRGDRVIGRTAMGVLVETWVEEVGSSGQRGNISCSAQNGCEWDGNRRFWMSGLPQGRDLLSLML